MSPHDGISSPRVTPVTANSGDRRCVAKITSRKLLHAESTTTIKAFQQWVIHPSGSLQQTHPAFRGGNEELRKCLSRSSAQTRSAPVVGGASTHGSTHCRIRPFVTNCWPSPSGTSSASADTPANGSRSTWPSEIPPGAVCMASHGILRDIPTNVSCRVTRPRPRRDGTWRRDPVWPVPLRGPRSAVTHRRGHRCAGSCALSGCRRSSSPHPVGRTAR